MKFNKQQAYLIPLIIGGLLAGCRGMQHEPIKLSIPFVEQHPEDCGAATLAMLLEHYEISATLDELEKFLFVPALKGTTPELIADMALQKGLRLEQARGDWAFLVEKLEQSLPVIVFFGPATPDQPGHFAVVTGVNRYRTRIRLHNGSHKNRWMLRENFMARWKQGGYTLLWPSTPN